MIPKLKISSDAAEIQRETGSAFKAVCTSEKTGSQTMFCASAARTTVAKSKCLLYFRVINCETAMHEKEMTCHDMPPHQVLPRELFLHADWRATLEALLADAGHYVV